MPHEHQRAITTIDHILGPHVDGVLGDDAEERLQIVRVGTHRVRASPTTGEAQEVVDQRMTNTCMSPPSPPAATRRTCGNQTMTILLVRALPEERLRGRSAQLADHPYK